MDVEFIPSGPSVSPLTIDTNVPGTDTSILTTTLMVKESLEQLMSIRVTSTLMTNTIVMRMSTLMMGRVTTTLVTIKEVLSIFLVASS